MKIAIAGSRGIPNNYGGFEQCAEHLAVLLSAKGHQVTVYNPTYHEFNGDNYMGVKIVRINNPEKVIGTIGNFIYDFKCMRQAYRSEEDILLMLGYTTSSLFFPLLKSKSTVLVTNMDGLEWKRDKWNAVVKIIAKWFEALGAKNSDYLVSDNREIRRYLQETYQKDSFFIPYGATVFNNPDHSVTELYGVKPYSYDMLIARLEKENNIESILDGIVLSGSDVPFLVIGNHETNYGVFLKNKYKSSTHIIFKGGVYNLNHLNNLRWFSRFYFHGHSVGGTNPSLLEAMASGALIVAHDNAFNRDVLGDHAYYFSGPQNIKTYIESAGLYQQRRKEFIEGGFQKIREQYNWDRITDQYEEVFLKVRK